MSWRRSSSCSSVRPDAGEEPVGPRPAAAAAAAAAAADGRHVRVRRRTLLRVAPADRYASRVDSAAEAQGVVDRPGGDLIEADQTGQDRVAPRRRPMSTGLVAARATLDRRSLPNLCSQPSPWRGVE